MWPHIMINGCGQYMGGIDRWVWQYMGHIDQWVWSVYGSYRSRGVVNIWVVLINGCGQYMGRIDQWVWSVYGSYRSLGGYCLSSWLSRVPHSKSSMESSTEGWR